MASTLSAETRTCSACGSELTPNAFASGDAITHAGKAYCSACGTLILPPDVFQRARDNPEASAPAAPKAPIFVPVPSKQQDDDALSVDKRVAKPSSKPALGAVTFGKPSAPAVNTPPQVIEKPAVEPEPAPQKNAPGKISGRGASVNKTSSRGTSTSGRSAEKVEKESRSSRDTKKNIRVKGKDSGNSLYIGLGVAAALVVVIALAFRGKAKPPEVKVTKPEVEIEEDKDKTPSSVYARKAEELRAKGDNLGAAKYFDKAAVQAERLERNSDQAQHYASNSYQLKKFTVLEKH